ncbi:hypothetical protein LCGC14_1377080 [marine sediment metagenome]|uniref:Uncharacterized protein n=1 Tax=marine sediment metagenome TaxID=412755 RepID=A0A0F9N5K8_9ZZZZ|nr:hypothetical protein [Desulfobacterales bacterium]
MREFRIQLFPSGSMQPKGFLGAIKSIFGVKQKLRKGDFLDLNIGGLTEYDYNCVDVYSNALYPIPSRIVKRRDTACTMERRLL